MKSNKRTIDEDTEKLNYITQKQEANGTLENLKIKKLKETKMKEKEGKMKMTGDSFNPNEQANDVIKI